MLEKINWEELDWPAERFDGRSSERQTKVKKHPFFKGRKTSGNTPTFQQTFVGSLRPKILRLEHVPGMP